MKATIYKSTGSWYSAHCEDGVVRPSRLAGKMKLDHEISSSNPIAVGDRVRLHSEDGQDSAVISEIEERENYMVRASPNPRYQRQVLAANLDQVVLLASLRQPFTPRGFIDRFLVTAEAYHIPALLMFNKTDIYQEKDWLKFDNIREIYGRMGYPVLKFSALKEEVTLQVQRLLKDKTTLIAGNSGAGKSTFINTLIPGLNQKTQNISNWSEKGVHTTTFAEMFDLPFGGRLIDTPGIREWGLLDIEKAELSQYFLDLQPYLNQCKFNNCLHVNEPGCAVKQAVAEGKIELKRFESYLIILDSIILNKG